MLGEALGEAGRAVQPGADRRAALRQLEEIFGRLLDAPHAVFELRHVAGKFLAERQRRRVLRMRAADLDDVRELRRLLGRARPCSFCTRRQQVVARSPRAAAMCIAVGKVSFDDWLILTWSFGWTGFFDPSSPPSISIARLEITSLAFMLVCVPEPVCQTTSGKLSSSLPSITSCAAAAIASARRGVELAEVLVGERRGALDDAEGADQRHRHRLGADAEIHQRARGLRAPISVRRHFQRTEGIGLRPRLRHRRSRRPAGRPASQMAVSHPARKAARRSVSHRAGEFSKSVSLVAPICHGRIHVQMPARIGGCVRCGAVTTNWAGCSSATVRE